MKRLAGTLGPILLGVALAAAAPPGLPFSATSARAATRLVCSSYDRDYAFCRVDTRGGVRLVQQLSRAPCIPGRTWGSDGGGIWVDHGCSAQFAAGSAGPSSGALVGALVIGGLLGAALSDRDSPYRRDDEDSRNYEYRHHYRPPAPPPPPYDRYGNANYDRQGRYQGCHGLGCQVDNPDARRADDQAIDPTPQFDRNGNPNFDTHGNYIGPHGLGALVDDPDSPG